MATMVHKIQYLSDCVDDLNSTSRLMRKWLEETPQIVYGEGLWVEVDFLRNNFNDWKQQNGLRGTQSSGVSRPQPLEYAPLCRCLPSRTCSRHMRKPAKIW